MTPEADELLKAERVRADKAESALKRAEAAHRATIEALKTEKSRADKAAKSIHDWFMGQAIVGLAGCGDKPFEIARMAFRIANACVAVRVNPDRTE